MLCSRRYRRVVPGVESRVWVVDRPLKNVRVANISFGGLCLELDWPFDLGTEYRVLLDLRGPIKDAASVTIVIRWKALRGQRWYCGAEVIKSDQAWLGPEDYKSSVYAAAPAPAQEPKGVATRLLSTALGAGNTVADLVGFRNNDRPKSVAAPGLNPVQSRESAASTIGDNTG